MKAMDGGQMAADPVSLRRSPWVRIAAFAGMEMGRDNTRSLSLTLTTIWLSMILTGMFAGAPQNLGPAEAAANHMIIGIIATVALYVNLFDGLFNDRRFEELRELREQLAANEERLKAVEERDAARDKEMGELREQLAAVKERASAGEGRQAAPTPRT